MLTIDHLLSVQKAFNHGRFIDYEKSTDLERQEYTKDTVLHLLGEAHEVLDLVNWKMHNRGKPFEVDKFEVALELVDVLKFWGNLVAAWGIDERTVMDLFVMKSKVVEGRWMLQQMQPPTGPRVCVSYELMEKEPVVVREYMLLIRDKYDAHFAIINTNDLTSRQKFDLEYAMTGVYVLPWELIESSQAEARDCALMSSREGGVTLFSWNRTRQYESASAAFEAVDALLTSDMKEMLS